MRLKQTWTFSEARSVGQIDQVTKDQLDKIDRKIDCLHSKVVENMVERGKHDTHIKGLWAVLVVLSGAVARWHLW